jgi:peptidyl-prolyl cis-trans isomerase SurA
LSHPLFDALARHGAALLAAAVLALPASAVLALPAAADEVLVDGIAAQVGSDIVLLSEINAMTEPLEKRLREQGIPEKDLVRVRAEGLEQLIEWKLIEKIIRDSGLAASDAEVDEIIDNIARENGLTRAQLEASVSSHDMTFEDYRAQIKREYERQKVVNAMVGAQVRVEEDEVRLLYRQRFEDQPEGGEEVHLRQLLVTAGEGTGRDHGQACQATVDAAARIAMGESFEELATELSAAAPQHGGDIGWLHVDSMAGWMQEVIAPLEPGQTTGVLEVPYGCTILKLVERKGYEPVTFEMARSALEQELYQQKLQESYREWMEELRSHTYIERRGYFADAARMPRAPEDPARP